MYSSRGWSYSTSPTPGLAGSAYRRRRRLDLGWLLRLGPLPLALAVVGGVAWYHFAFAGFPVDGSIVDGSTGAGISGARAWSGESSAVADDSGRFHLAGVKPPEPLSFQADGYLGTTDRPGWPGQPVSVQLEPIGLQVAVTDAETGVPVSDAQVADGKRTATALEGGQFRLSPVKPTDVLHVTAAGYLPRDVPYAGDASMSVALAPNLTGMVTDARTGLPVKRARLHVGSAWITPDATGHFTLQSRPTGDVTILAPGYRAAHLGASARDLDVQLQPVEVKGLYMTYFAIGHPDYVKRMYELLDTTELNAVVIDVKGDYGLLAYHSNVPLAQQIGANDQPTVSDIDGLLRTLHERGVYVIARIVAFKDDKLARNGPKAGVDVSIKDRRDGKPWVDGEGLAWVDAFQPAAWDYNVALAREAIQHGFDEVQYDYVRFPTDPPPGGSVEDTQYSKPFTEPNRVDALKSFLQRAHQAVNAAGGYLGIDTFGYTTWWDDDGGIGQDLGVLADQVDYFSPMVYPSTYSAGVPGSIPFPDVVKRPYDVIYRSLQHVWENRLAGKDVVIRPWIQYFDDYPWATGTRYDAPQIEAQKRAVADGKGYGWMLWNPGSQFDRGGLAPKT